MKTANLVVGILNLALAILLICLGDVLVALCCGCCGAFNLALWREPPTW